MLEGGGNPNHNSSMTSLMLTLLLVTILTTTMTNSQCFTQNDRQGASQASTPAVVSELMSGYSEFAFDLFRSVDGKWGTHTDPDPDDNQIPTANVSLSQTRKQKRDDDDDDDHQEHAGNVFFSPVSVWSALLVTHLGARGGTESEIGHAIGLARTTPKAAVARAYQFLKSCYYLRARSPDAPFVFRMANHIYLQEGEEVRPCLSQYLGDDLATANFTTQPDAARLAINAWVEKETQSKIRNLLPSGSVDTNTRIVLVNAAYFKGTWQQQFDPAKTERAHFLTDQKVSVPVDMMKTVADFRYIRSGRLECELVELPYAGGQLSMFVVLPDETSTVDGLVARLTGATFDRLIEAATSHRVSVSLPRFKMEEALELRPHLMELGIKQLFDAGRSDLSGFTGSSDMRVGSVRHKAFVDVGENGTEASAATSLMTFRDNVQPNIFRVDRPFVFVIRDNLLNTVLFVGALRRPEAAAAVATKRPNGGSQGSKRRGSKRRLSASGQRVNTQLTKTLKAKLNS